MEDKNMGLSVKIENKRPVALTDLTLSLNCFADEYARFIEMNGEDAPKGKEPQLFVREIRSGSIITELEAAIPYALAFVDHASTVVEYVKYLKTTIEFLVGKSEKRPDGMTKASYQNLANIVEPIAKDNGSMLVIGTINVAENAVINISVNAVEANALQNAAKREIAALKEPEVGNMKKFCCSGIRHGMIPTAVRVIEQ